MTAAAALAPLNAQALVPAGNFGKQIKKSARASKPSVSADTRLKQMNDSLLPYSPRNSSAARDSDSSADNSAPIVPASLGGLARSLPTGIYTASGNVTTSCFNPRLVNLLSNIHQKYHRPVIITSGYRSPAHNIKAGGVRGSLHLACAAADIKVPGVNKFQLASFVRSLPNRGGVGLYCHQAVHVDIGTPREWNWCSGRR